MQAYPVTTRVLLCSIFLCFSAAVNAALEVVPSAPKVAAKSHLLQDFHSGVVIVENEADTKMEPASLTKMMSAYVVSQELRAGNLALTDEVTISEKAWRAPGSRMFVEVNKQVPVEALLKGIIVQSGNDATIALAEHIAGSERTFASLMNQYADSLGMHNTHFTNSTGLPDPEHYSTARDLATMARALIRDFPDHYAWYSIREFTYNDIKQHNRNRLLWRDQHVDGVKTGHTDAAGYCLVASALRDDMRLISVVLGAKSERAREQESQKLLNYGFRFYETHRLYSTNEPLTEARIWGGQDDLLPLGLAKDLYVTVPRGQYQRLKPTISYETIIKAPVVRGQSLGSLNIAFGEDNIQTHSLIALRDIAQGSWWKRLFDSVRLFISQLFD